MNLFITNPWGFCALLGIPLLVLVYYLRRRAKVVTVTTLFLLKRTERESQAGRRFETFSNSLPFWLQILAVLFLTWILVEPKYGEYRMTRQIAIVLDSSASMQAVRETLEEKLKKELSKMKGSADHAAYFVLDHDPKRPRIYQGDDVEELLDKLNQWNPSDGALDPRASLRIARSLVGPGGVVVYLTDHEGEELPFSSHRLAIGEAKENCGFTGASVEKEDDGFVWTALVKNHGATAQTRKWWVETLGRERTEPRTFVLPAGRLTTLRGRFPEGRDRCMVRLSVDAMPLDDILPMIVKEPRVARMLIKGDGEIAELGERMANGFDHVRLVENSRPADFLLSTVESGREKGSDKPTILFFDEVAKTQSTGRWLSEEDPLTSGLNFEALQPGGLEKIVPRADDRVLLWLGGEPVILLRRDPVSRAEQLVFAFSLRGSNAAKVPAIAVLLHRFCEKVARDTLSKHTGVLETRQLMTNEFPENIEGGNFSLVVTGVSGETDETALPKRFRTTQRAPEEPGFLSLDLDGKRLLDAAVIFADTREADLSGAVSSELPKIESGLAELQSTGNRWWRGVVLAALGSVLMAWKFLIPRTKA